MEELLHENKTFTKIIYSEKQIKNREFEQCTFVDCDFSNSDFSFNRFSDCTFIGCNLAMLKLAKTSLCVVHFKQCKLLGVNFSECEDFLFEVSFNECVADYASFRWKKMAKTKFINTSLQGVFFDDANLSSALFDKVNLQGAVFNRTDLKEADFRTAEQYTIDPELNNVRKAKFSFPSVLGLLAKHNINVEIV
ncbi:pentapeptide repeat-containing protein [Flavobacterium sp. '19STA2R22 D10 B1']|uniref:pentapeptide repeat-containing protein n=1 Tax=Flavobacterium aerium TaxID=3037261 RepID=UPI00278C5FE2|nr:pentapeptide repeat-containing protein [Flavobacterium sp. '19STA2R22 D10 B1']